jgi:hypothetical protein
VQIDAATVFAASSLIRGLFSQGQTSASLRSSILICLTPFG